MPGFGAGVDLSAKSQRQRGILKQEVATATREDVRDVIWHTELVDTLTRRTFSKPGSIDTVVTTKLQEEILSYVAAALTGSLGMAPKGNVDPERRFPSRRSSRSALPAWASRTFAALAFAASSQTLAQPGPSSETARSRYIAERAQLGLLEYCQAQGLVGLDAVERQRQTVAALPPVPGLGDAEEAAGRNGIIAFHGPQATFADDAQGKGITLKSNCEYLVLRLR